MLRHTRSGKRAKTLAVVEYLRRSAWAEVRHQLYRDQRGLCAYCRRPMIEPGRAGRHAADDPRQATLDHVVPRAAGGTSDVANLVVACRQCNHDKGSSPAGRLAEGRAS